MTEPTVPNVSQKMEPPNLETRAVNSQKDDVPKKPPTLTKTKSNYKDLFKPNAPKSEDSKQHWPWYFWPWVVFTAALLLVVIILSWQFSEKEETIVEKIVYREKAAASDARKNYPITNQYITATKEKAPEKKVEPTETKVTLIPKRSIARGTVLSSAIPVLTPNSTDSEKNCILCTKWVTEALADNSGGIFRSVEKTSAMLWNLYSQNDADAKKNVESKFHKLASESGTKSFDHTQMTVAKMFENETMYTKSEEPFNSNDIKGVPTLKDPFAFGLVKASSDDYVWGSPGKGDACGCPFWNRKNSAIDVFTKYKKSPLWEMDGSTETKGNDGDTIVLKKWYKLNSWARNVYVCLVPPLGAKYLYVSNISTAANSGISYVGLVHNTDKVKITDAGKHLVNATSLGDGTEKKVPVAHLMRVTTDSAVEITRTKKDILAEANRPSQPFGEPNEAPTMMMFNLKDRDQINVIGKVGISKNITKRSETTWMYTKELLGEKDLVPPS